MGRARSILSWLVCAAVAGLILLSPARADRRIALVIGNSNYQHAGLLANPANNSTALAALLRAAGFSSVELKRDLGIAEMRRTLGDFSEAARNADMALLFYAGHGIEVDGTNYLIPVDARLARDFDVEDEAISLERVLRAIEPARRLRFVMLDACRDNPFLRTMKRASRSVGRGLARVEPTSDTLVAFATEAGTIAADGEATMSPFTNALLRHLATPGLDLRIAFGRVRDDVMRVTGNRQRPFIYGSLGGTTISIVEAPPVQVAAPPPAAITPDPCAAAEAHWRSAEAIGTKAAYEDHVARFGGCIFAGLAAARIAAVERETRERADAAADEQRKRAEAAAEEQRRRTEVATRQIQEQHEREAVEARRKAEAEAERKRIAVLPPPAARPEKEKPQRATGFDGIWTMTRSVTSECGVRSSVFTIRIQGGVVRSPGGTGSISPSGALRVPGRANVFTGTLRGSSGSGTYSGKCSGTFTASRN